jgi:hypothetical protein
MATTYCHWHADRETGLRCSDCSKAMCVECMRQHPVSIRCKECERAYRLPTYQVSASYISRGVGAAMGLGVAGFIALRVIAFALPFVGFFFFFTMMGLGYVMGEGVSAAVNKRRGRPYQYMALAAVLIATSMHLIIALFSLSIGSLFTFGGIAIAGAFAWRRLEP